MIAVASSTIVAAEVGDGVSYDSRDFHLQAGVEFTIWRIAVGRRNHRGVGRHFAKGEHEVLDECSKHDVPPVEAVLIGLGSHSTEEAAIRLNLK